MRGPAVWLVVPWAVWLAACDPPSHEYLAASAISHHGFARDTTVAQAMSGKVVRVWGFVDHANLYGDTASREILGDWWSGDGPDPSTWRFNLKASAADPAGWSFPVYVRVDDQTDALLRSIVADARAVLVGGPSQAA